MEREKIAKLIDEFEAEVNKKAQNGVLPPGLEEQLRLQITTLRDEKVPDCEIILFPGYYYSKGKSVYSI